MCTVRRRWPINIVSGAIYALLLYCIVLFTEVISGLISPVLTKLNSLFHLTHILRSFTLISFMPIFILFDYSMCLWIDSHLAPCGALWYNGYITLAFGFIGHGFESEHRLFSHHRASAFSKLRSVTKCWLDDSVRRLLWFTLYAYPPSGQIE